MLSSCGVDEDEDMVAPDKEGGGDEKKRQKADADRLLHLEAGVDGNDAAEDVVEGDTRQASLLHTHTRREDRRVSKLRRHTPPTPRTRIMSANSSWGGNCRMPSTRYW